MATRQQEKRRADQASQASQALDALIGEQVLHRLGQPAEGHRVQVRRVWANHYRVNVFVGPDLASSRVAHSYFLVADGDGNVIESTPKITRQY